MEEYKKRVTSSPVYDDLKDDHQEQRHAGKERRGDT